MNNIKISTMYMYVIHTNINIIWCIYSNIHIVKIFVPILRSCVHIQYIVYIVIGVDIVVIKIRIISCYFSMIIYIYIYCVKYVCYSFLDVVTCFTCWMGRENMCIYILHYVYCIVYDFILLSMSTLIFLSHIQRKHIFVCIYIYTYVYTYLNTYYIYHVM